MDLSSVVVTPDRNHRASKHRRPFPSLSASSHCQNPCHPCNPWSRIQRVIDHGLLRAAVGRNQRFEPRRHGGAEKKRSFQRHLCRVTARLHSKRHLFFPSLPHVVFSVPPWSAFFLLITERHGKTPLSILLRKLSCGNSL